MQISCKLYNCCVKKNGLETCAACSDFPCEKYDKFFDGDSFISHRVCLPNIERIKQVGLTKWLREQCKRRRTLENLLAGYNEGRSCSFNRVATALMPMPLIDKSVKQAQKAIAADNVPYTDVKAKAKTLRAAIQGFASKEGIDLKLRTGPKK